LFFIFSFGDLATSLVGSSTTASLSVFLPLSAVGLFALAQSHRHVVTSTFSLQRLDQTLSIGLHTGKFPTPNEIGAAETFWLPYCSRIQINPPITSLRDPGWVTPNSISTAGCIWVTRDATAKELLESYVAATLLQTNDTVTREMLEHVLHELTDHGWHVDYLHFGPLENCIHIQAKPLGESLPS
jgi:hypothetical protein